jgi:hypothetical protein
MLLFLALIICANAQTSMCSSSTPTSSACPSSTRSSISSRTSTGSPTVSRTSLTTRSSTASPTVSRTSLTTRTSTASPSFSKSPKPSIDVNTRSVSYTIPPSITPSSLASAQPSPSAFPTNSSQATFSVTPSQTPTRTVTRTPFCPYGADKFLNPDKDCNGKTYDAIVAGLFFSALFIYLGWLLIATCISSCIIDCMPPGRHCCDYMPACFTITTLYFPPFLPFALLIAVTPLICRAYTTFTRSATAFARSVIPPAPPSMPPKVFLTKTCAICLEVPTIYLMYKCGHTHCEACTLQWKNEEKHFCPTCRAPHPATRDFVRLTPSEMDKLLPIEAAVQSATGAARAPDSPESPV